MTLQHELVTRDKMTTLTTNCVSFVSCPDSIKQKINKDNKLKFKSHVKNVCKKASQKIWALSRLTNYLKDSEKKTTF